MLDNNPSRSVKVGTMLGAIPGGMIKFLLEVAGAMGATWGGSEVLGLRNEENSDSWRIAAIFMGMLALLRQPYAYKYTETKKNPDTNFWGGFFHSIVDPYSSIKTNCLAKETQERQHLLN
jgi:hypothetical protein